MSVSLDPQAIGWEDDGSESGLLRVQGVHGPLVRVPFRLNHYWVEKTGAGDVIVNPTILTSNPDGTGTALQLATGATTDDTVRLHVPFIGTAFGVYFLRTSSATPDFSVTVDGDIVHVSGTHQYLRDEGMTTQLVDGESMAITHPYLPPGQHYAVIDLVGQASGALALFLFGTLRDAAAGYQPPIRTLHAVSTAALTTTQTAIGLAPGTATERTLRGVRKIVYTNITASPVIVTIRNGANVLWARSVPANDSIEFDPGGVLSINSGYTHAAASAAAVNATVIGGY